MMQKAFYNMPIKAYSTWTIILKCRNLICASKVYFQLCDTVYLHIFI